MTIGIEYTETFSFSVAGAGEFVNYFKIGSTVNDPVLVATNVFVVKYLSVSSTGGFNNTTPDYSVRCVTSTSNTGTATKSFISSNPGSTTANNQVIVLIDDKSVNGGLTPQINCSTSYFGVQVNATGAGTVSVTISYLAIPSTPETLTLYNSFKAVSGVAAPGLTVLANPSSTAIVKSINIINSHDLTDDYTVQFVMVKSGVIVSYLASYPVVAGNSASLDQSIFLSPAITLPALQLGFYITAATTGTGVDYYYSYAEES